jgi:pyrroline-5-carboxylate reductase
MTRVGMIGIGNMGSALLKGWSQDKSLSLCGYDINIQQLKKVSMDSGMEAKESALQVVMESDYVVLGVKPQQMQSLPLPRNCKKTSV